MRDWNQLFVRHGWLLTQKEECVFDCNTETRLNLDFLMECLGKANVDYRFEEGLLKLPTTSFSEEKWLEAIAFDRRGRGGDLWFQPGVDAPKVRELDTYISGVVRQLNRLGFYTKGSCDGHGRRPAHVMITKNRDIKELAELFVLLGQKRITWREHLSSYHIPLNQSQLELLDLAEQLSLIEYNWLEKGLDFIKEQLFHHSLEQLLMVPGESGREDKIRAFVYQKLAAFVDFLTVDHAGNILAERTYRSGHGPTILLNAHLDTVYEKEKDRKIIKDGTKWSSSKGILGADDRAGVAILLHIAEHLHQTRSFSGKVKFIFTVEEECGLVGASNVNNYFLWGTDAAIVVDRRGQGDIVTSCGGLYSFCHPSYGKFFENVATAAGLDGWTTTAGGSSDTRVWAEHGIQSVNLSVGYQNEHTGREMLDVAACYETVKLVKAVFEEGRELKRVVRGIKREEVAVSII